MPTTDVSPLHHPGFGPSFAQGLKDTPINELAFGTCGEAVYFGKPVTCADIAKDDRWSPRWRDLCGLTACWRVIPRPYRGRHLPWVLYSVLRRARMPSDLDYRLSTSHPSRQHHISRDRSEPACANPKRVCVGRWRSKMSGSFSSKPTVHNRNQRRFLRMSGYSRGILSKIGALGHNDTAGVDAPFPESSRRFEATGRTTPYQKQYIRKDGSRWVALFAATQLNEAEGTWNLSLTLRSQTSRS